MGYRQLHLICDEGLTDRGAQQIDLPWGVVRDAEGTHLAGALEVIERAGHLCGLDQRVGPVQQQDVDVVRSQ